MNITKQPDSLSFNGNKNWLTLTPQTIGSPIDPYAKLKIGVLASVNGDTFYINDIKFTASDDLNDSDTFLPAIGFPVPSGPAIEATADSIVEAINSNYILSRDYYAYRINELTAQVEVVARREGPQYNLTGWSGINTPALLFQYNTGNKWEGDPYSSYSYRVDVYFSDGNYPFTYSNNETLVAQLIQSVNKGDSLSFDLSPYSDAKLTYPTFDGYSREVINRYLAKVYATYTNEFHVERSNYLIDTNYWYSVLGGVNDRQRLDFNEEDYTGIYLQPTRNPLTTLFKRKTVYGTPNNQREFLTFIYADIQGGNYNLATKLRVRFIDGTEQTSYVNLIPVSDTNRNGKLIVDISPDYLGLEAIEDTAGKEILWYEVSEVILETNPKIVLTKPIRYEVLRDCSENQLQVLFLNPLGAWETFYFTGVNNKSLSYSTIKFDKTSIPVYDDKRFATSTYKTEVGQVQTLNSRYLNKLELDWLIGLIQSPYIYLINNDNSLLPVTFDKAEWLYNAVDELYTVNIEVTYSHSYNSIGG